MKGHALTQLHRPKLNETLRINKCMNHADTTSVHDKTPRS
jgi:hypothetical protein